MLDLRRADAVRQRAERAMRRGVAVAADDGHARQGEALFRPDDVDDALALVLFGIIFDAEIGGVLRQRLDLDAALGILDAFHPVRRRRHVVVDDGERLFGRVHLTVCHAQPLEGLRAGHLVNEVAVDIEQRGAVLVGVDDVVIPDLVVKGARCGHVRCVHFKLEVSENRRIAGSAGAQPSRDSCAIATRAKKRDGRRLRSCSVKLLKPGCPNSFSMAACLPSFSDAGNLGMCGCRCDPRDRHVSRRMSCAHGPSARAAPPAGAPGRALPRQAGWRSGRWKTSQGLPQARSRRPATFPRPSSHHAPRP
jgi:hypothetical protein